MGVTLHGPRGHRKDGSFLRQGKPPATSRSRNKPNPATSQVNKTAAGQEGALRVGGPCRAGVDSRCWRKSNGLPMPLTSLQPVPIRAK